MGSALHDHWPCVSGLGRSLPLRGPVIGQAPDGGVPQPGLLQLAEPQAPGRLSLRRAASLARGSAGGPRGPGSLRPQPETTAGADLRPGGPQDLR